MKLSDEKLQYAAKLAAKAELEPWLDYEAYEEPVFSAKFQQRMQALIKNVRAGNVAQDRARLGWQYYGRRGLAAVLLCFLLSCVAMPEAVMAGGRKVIEVVRTVFEEYTEYHFTSRESDSTQFVPISLNYLPEGIYEAEREEHPTTLRIIFQNNAGQNILILRQSIFTESFESGYIVDTEDAQITYCMVQDEMAELITKDDRVQFVWEHGTYLITGQTRLSKEEVILILQNITL